ncbi:MAG: TonB-dependent receptor plug domain-containing protein [Brevundimonas sp.]
MDDLAALSLEDLSRLEVTSVSRRPQALSSAAAAVFVISAEDIRRSGADSLPEVLRLAPNLDVQQVNSVEYAISARGFNGYETSNKLLVLLDGRSLYSTLSSGVFWDANDIPLEEIERIEVVSGPGGALYGSNAMNGVINIITWSAASTGPLAAFTAGTEASTAYLRHGGAAGPNGRWRIYASAYSRDDSGAPATDQSDGLRLGSRADWVWGDNLLSLSAGAYANQVTVNEDFSGDGAEVSGGHFLAAWSRPLGNGSLEARGYVDLFERSEVATLEESTTWDLTLQYNLTAGRHAWVMGLGHRVVDSEFTAPPGGAFLDPPQRSVSLTNIFIQDQIQLARGLTLTVGAKWEDNSYSGQEFLPNIRLGWERQNGDLLWGAVSRASRTPNRIERDLTLPGFLVGGDFSSEALTAYEIGYRATPRPWASYSVSIFYNDYDELRTASLDPVTVFPIRLTNFGSGRTWGVEAWGSVEPVSGWRLSAGVSTLEKDLGAPVDRDITSLISQGDDPAAHGYLRSQLNLTRDWTFDAVVRGAEALAATPAYVDADARLGWRIREGLELSLSGRNLLHDERIQTGDPLRRRAIQRSVHLGLRAAF